MTQVELQISPAEAARKAMRLMVERRLSPTPENYRWAWEQVGGSAPAEDSRVEPVAAGPSAPASGAPAREPDIDWGEQIVRIVAALDRVDPGWTPARKRSGLQRVIGTSRDAPTLAERLEKLALAWSQPYGELTELVPAGGPAAAAGTPDPKSAPPAAQTLAGDELAGLALDLCESLVAVAKSQQWGQGVVDVVRSALTRPIRADAVARAREVLRRTYAEQSDLAESRQASNDALRQTLSQWMRWIGDLDETTDRFSSRLQAHATRAGQCEQVDEARRIVESVVSDAGAMRAEIAATRETFVRARDKATALQARVEQLESRLAEASNRILIDELTEVFNRRGLELHFERLERDCRLRGRPLAVAMIDIDDFKRLNDELGHQGGDMALRHICGQLVEGLGPAGVLARFGGEEFVLLLPGADIERADAHLAELQGRLAAAVFSHMGEQRSLRFSGGVTVCARGDTLEALLGRADEALYRAKRAGKNCVRRA